MDALYRNSPVYEKLRFTKQIKNPRKVFHRRHLLRRQEQEFNLTNNNDPWDFGVEASLAKDDVNNNHQHNNLTNFPIVKDFSTLEDEQPHKFIYTQKLPSNQMFRLEPGLFYFNVCFNKHKPKPASCLITL